MIYARKCTALNMSNRKEGLIYIPTSNHESADEAGERQTMTQKAM